DDHVRELAQPLRDFLGVARAGVKRQARDVHRCYLLPGESARTQALGRTSSRHPGTSIPTASRRPRAATWGPDPEPAARGRRTRQLCCTVRAAGAAERATGREERMVLRRRLLPLPLGEAERSQYSAFRGEGVAPAPEAPSP